MFGHKPSTPQAVPPVRDVTITVTIPGQMCQGAIITLKQWAIMAVLLWSGVMITGSSPLAPRDVEPPVSEPTPAESSQSEGGRAILESERGGNE